LAVLNAAIDDTLMGELAYGRLTLRSVTVMAQWRGQFLGKSHQSKVFDREAILRHAIEVYRCKQSDVDRLVQAKNVIRLADRLRIARIRVIKARLNALGPLRGQSALANEMEEDIRKLVENGVRAILEEFQAADISMN
jgi:hypothetical protein